MCPQESAYKDMELLAQEAFHLSLTGDIYHAQELLLRVRNALKRLSGDLPIVGYNALMSDSVDTPFVTQSLEEARAWGWLEIASGAFRLVENRPGASMVHFKARVAYLASVGHCYKQRKRRTTRGPI